MANIFKAIGEFASTGFGLFLTSVLGIAGLIALPFSTVIGGVLIGISSLLSVAGARYLMEETTEDVRTGSILKLRKQSNVPLPVLYGKAKLSGNIVYADTWGENNEKLLLVIAIAEGGNLITPTGNIPIYFDDTPVSGFEYVSKSALRWDIRIKDLGIKNITIHLKYKYKSDPNSTRLIRKNCPHDITWRYSEHVFFRFSIPLKENYNKIGISKNIVSCPSSTYTDDIIYVYISNQIKRKVLPFLGEIWIPTPEIVVEVIVKDEYKYEVSIENVWLDEISYDGVNYISTIIDYSKNFYFGLIDTENGKIVGDGRYYNIAKKSGFKPAKNVLYLTCYLIYNKDKFTSVPNIQALIYGRLVYDPRIRKKVHSDNPALVLYDYLTNTAFGFGLDPKKIDIQSVIESADYCDQMGFTFNAPITNGNATEIINLILNHFRGYILFKDGKYHIKFRDLRYETVSAIIDENEIIDGTFEVVLPDVTEIPNSIKVNFIDEKNNFKVNSITIEDKDYTDKDKRQIEIDLIGAHEEQAKVLGIYYLERMKLSTTISFTTSPKYANLEIGDIIKVTYKPYGIKDQLFRIEKIALNEDGLCNIVAIIEDEKLYNKTFDITDYNIDITNLPEPYKPIVYNDVIDLEEVYIEDKSGKLINALKITFNDTIPMADKYQIWIKDIDNNKIVHVETTDGSPVLINGLPELVNLEVEIKPVNPLGQVGYSTRKATIKLLGKYKPPPDVTNFNVSYSNGNLIFTWDEVEDLDLIGYEIRVGNDWETGSVIVTKHKSTKFVLPVSYAEDKTLTFFIKAMDSVGNYSVNPDSATITIKGKPDKNIIVKQEIDLYNHTQRLSAVAKFQNWAFRYVKDGIKTDFKTLYPQYADQQKNNPTCSNLYYYPPFDIEFYDYASYIMNFDTRTWNLKLADENFTTWQDWYNKYGIWAEPVPYRDPNDPNKILLLIKWETITFDLGKNYKAKIYFDDNWLYRKIILSDYKWTDIGNNTHTWLQLGDINDKWTDLTKPAMVKYSINYSGNQYGKFEPFGGEAEFRQYYLYANYDLRNDKQILIIKDHAEYYSGFYYYNGQPHIYITDDYFLCGFEKDSYRSYIVVDVPDIVEQGTLSVSGNTVYYYQNNFNVVKSIILTSQTDGKYPILIDYNSQWMEVKMNDGGDGIVHFVIYGY